MAAHPEVGRCSLTQEPAAPLRMRCNSVVESIVSRMTELQYVLSAEELGLLFRRHIRRLEPQSIGNLLVALLAETPKPDGGAG